MLPADKSENKNLKDMTNYSSMVIKDMNVSISYSKTDKLITALYMVTDIIDKDEPIRNKLRTLGTEIISDIHSLPVNACSRIDQIVSFLDLSSALNIISEMNCRILRKEFAELNKSIRENNYKVGSTPRAVNLSEFFRTESGISIERYPNQYGLKDMSKSIGHINGTRIGVQKASTLMRVLSDKTNHLSDTSYIKNTQSNFDLLKKERRDKISNIIKTKGANVAIKDIMLEMNSGATGGVSCSEKTLQRELMSMTKDGVLDKTGEKRWSRYSIKN